MSLGLWQRSMIAARALLGDPVGAVESLISTPAGIQASSAPRSRKGKGQQGTLAQQLLAAFLPANMRGFPSRTTADLLRAYSEIPALRVCINVVSSNYAKVGWVLSTPARSNKKSIYAAQEVAAFRREMYRFNTRERLRMRAELIRGGALKPITVHPMLDFLGSGCPPHLTGFQIRKLNQIYYMLTGESFIVMDRNGAGAPIQGVPVPPSWVRMIPNYADDRFYVQGYFGEQLLVPWSEMLWRKSVDPWNPFNRGSGQAKTVATELEVDEAIAEHQRNFFVNSARPDLLIMGNLGGTERTKQAETNWKSKLQGFRKSNLPYFMDTGAESEPGDIVVKDLSKSMETLKTSEIRSDTWQYIREVMGGVPPELIGITGQSNRATTDAAYYNLCRSTLEPIAEEEQAFLQQNLVPLYDPALIVEYVPFVEEDRQFYLSVIQAAPYSATIDEIRSLRDAAPLTGGEGKGFPLPMAITIVKDLSADPFAGPSKPSVAPSGSPAPASTESSPDNGGEPETTASPADPDPDDTLPEKAYRQLGQWHPAWARAVVRRNPRLTLRGVSTSVYMERIASKMAPRLRKLFLDAVEAAQGEIDLDALTNAIGSGHYAVAVNSLPTKDLSAAMQRSRALLHAAMQQAGEKAAADLAEETGSDFAFDGSHPAVTAWVEGRSHDLSTWIAKSTKQVAQDIIDDEHLAGDLTAAQAAEQIKQRLGLSPPDSAAVGNKRSTLAEAGATDDEIESQAATYAETLLAARGEEFGGEQAFQATQEGQRQGWAQAQKAGVVPSTASRYWLTQEDGDVCPTCGSIQGQERALDQPFSGKVKVAGVEEVRTFMNPGDPHPLCRCGAIIIYVSGTSTGDSEAQAA